ncbi:2-phosphosulfolactate phosphatase [Nocardia sp. NPDC059246]|uniref:2-phosphosulfolactate phosphatase n=1 Tax=unclassified Nocardia TaxID=2637762 RepID=UPI0036C71315
MPKPALLRDEAGAKLTLSPSSVTNLTRGDRVALVSLNGADIAGNARHAPALLVGSLRNRTAVAHWCAAALDRGPITRVTVVAAAEQWASTLDGVDGLRPSIEDWLGAGAIAHCAADTGMVLSAEAQAAATFAAAEQYGLTNWLRESTTGRELIAKGFSADVDAAADLDADHTVPKLAPDGFFTAADFPPG